MYLFFGQCDENAHAAARLYAEKFPQRRHSLPNVSAGFFLWGFVKNHVYQTPVIDRNDLVHRIENAFQLVTRNMLEHVNENIVKRARACVAASGNNFEHFL